LNEQALSHPNPQTDLTGGKWGKGFSANQSVRKAARCILEARLKAIWHWLPLAAEKSDEDAEYVHQLRISVRRAAQALRMFADLLPDDLREAVRARLRQIRLAADGARNWDVLRACFAHSAASPAEGVTARFAAQTQQRRREAQQPLVDVYHELTAAGFAAQIDALLSALQSSRKGKADRSFRQQARRYLRPVLKKFFKAAAAGVSNDEALHRLRLRTKKLRYTMELVAVAFAPGFRRRLYPRISMLQDMMGTVTDHATTQVLFQDWLRTSPDVEERAFCEGVLLAESRAHADVHREFLAVWTPETVARLRRQFGLYCDLP